MAYFGFGAYLLRHLPTYLQPQDPHAPDIQCHRSGLKPTIQ